MMFATGGCHGSSVLFASPFVVIVPFALIATSRCVTISPLTRNETTSPTWYWCSRTITRLRVGIVGVIEPVWTT